MRIRIAAITSSYVFPYHRTLFTGMAEAAEELDIDLIGITAGSYKVQDPEIKMRNALYEILDPDMFDGFILPLSSMAQYCGADVLLEKLKHLTKKPFVTIGAPAPDQPWVIPDYEEGMRLMAHHLVEDHGCTKFVFLRGLAGHFTSDLREQGLRKGLAEKGVDDSQMLLFHKMIDAKYGIEVVDELAKAGSLKEVQAIVCINDTMAFGAMKRLKELGFNVPEDIIVVGNSGSSDSMLSSPTLTTVDEHVQLTGYTAVRTVVHQIRFGLSHDKSVVPIEMKFRQSCGCVPLDDGNVLEPNRLAHAAQRIMDNQHDELVLTNPKEIQNFVEVLGDWIKTNKAPYFFQAYRNGLVNLKSIMHQEKDGQLSSYLQLFRRFGFTMISRGNFSELFRLLSETLNMRHCYVALYEKSDQPFQKARLIQLFSNGVVIPLDSTGILFDTKEIVPRSFMPRDRTSLVVQPLFFREEHLGFIVMDFTEHDGLIYEALVAQIAGVIKNELQTKLIVAAEQRFHDMAFSSSDWLWEIDEHGIITFSSGAIQKLFSMESDDFIGRDFFDFIYPGDKARSQDFKNTMMSDRQAISNTEIVSGIPDREQIFLSISGVPVITEQGFFHGYRGVCRDITLNKEAEEKIRFMAFYDPLTGLPNRRLFMDRLETALKNARRSDIMFAVMFVDLDNFKHVNDTLGHEQGDILLKMVATNFSSYIRDEDTLARLGGDEFVLLLPRLKSIDIISIIGERITGMFINQVELEGQKQRVTASIGIALYPQDDETSEGLLKKADSAMYAAKGSGKNRYIFYAPSMDVSSYSRKDMTMKLRDALRNNEFSIHFQPQYSILDKRIVGLEALLRWHDAENGNISPLEFIPVAEENGFILELEEWLLHNASKKLHEWRMNYGVDLRLAVNISTKRLKDAALVSSLCSLLKKIDFAPGTLEFEITERVIMDNEARAAGALKLFRQEGVRIALDDFGTGYSSLNHLKNFPIDTIKIDRSFIHELGVDKSNLVIVESMIRLGKGLDIDVIAEGVESKEQFDLLVKAGCRITQGNLYCKAVDENEIERMLAEMTKELLNT